MKESKQIEELGASQIIGGVGRLIYLLSKKELGTVMGFTRHLN